MNKGNFVFLAGHHRSGTSLLHEVLRLHPEVSGFSNTGVPEDEGQHLQSVYKTAKMLGGPGRYIFNSESYMDESHSLVSADNARKLYNEWSRYWDSGCTYFIEKSPPNLVRTRFLQSLFPNSKFIIILRHPLAVSYATQKWSRTSISSLIEHTLSGYEIFARDMRELDSVHVLRYEDFVNSPTQAIKSICNALNIGAVDVTHTIRKDVNEKYFEMWEKNRRNIIAKTLFKVDDSLERRANKFGYSLVRYRELIDCPLLSWMPKQVL